MGILMTIISSLGSLMQVRKEYVRNPKTNKIPQSL